MSAGSDQTEETPQSAARWRSWPLVAPLASWPGWERYGPAARSWSGAVAVNVVIATLFILGFGPVRRAPPPPVEPIPVQLFVELPEPPEPEPPEPEPPKPEPAPQRPAPPQPDPEPQPPKPVPPPPAPEPEPPPDLPPFVPLDAQPIDAPDVLGEAIPDIPLQAEATPQPLSDLPTFEAEPAPFFEAAPIPVPGPPTPTDVPLSSEPLQQDLPEFQFEPTPNPQPDPGPPVPEAPALPDEEDEDEGEAVAQAPAPSGATFGPPPSGIDLGPPPGGVGGLRGLLGEDKCRSREERLRGDCPPDFAGIQRPGNDLFGPDLTAGVRAYGEVVGVDESMRRARELDMTRKRPLPNGGVEGLGGINDLTGRLPVEHPDPGKIQ